MKRLAIAIVMVLSVALMSAVPAQAGSLRVSAKARPQANGKIVFSAKTSKPSRVRVKVYRGSKVVRTLSAHKSGKFRAYIATWNRRNGRGALVSAGTYSYKVTAIRGLVLRTARGKVRVRVTTTRITTSTTKTTPDAASSPRRWIGFYADGNMDIMTPLTTLESQIATKTAVAHLFVGDDELFPAARVSAIGQHGSIPLITLQFNSIGTTGLDAINNGSHDAYIIAFAEAARASGATIWLRPFHEMNGNWDTWSGTVGNNSPAKLVAAWRHVHDLFVASGATNVKFVWCPNGNSVPDTSLNALEAYWPGDAYVDYVATDIYNFGTSQSWSHWTSFTSGFSNAYNRITALTSKPFFIAEIGCSEVGGDKAAWATDMFSQIHTTFTKVVGIVWFNVNKETDWRVDSSTTSLAAFQNSLAQGY